MPASTITALVRLQAGENNTLGNNSTKPAVDLVLDSRDDVSAVLAVLGTLYGVEIELDLTVDSILRFSKIADKLGLMQLQQLVLQHLIDLVGKLPAAQQEDINSATAAIATIVTKQPECLGTYLADSFEQVAQHLKLCNQHAVDLWVTALPDPAQLKETDSNAADSLKTLLAAPNSGYMQSRLVEDLGDLEEVWGKIANGTRPRSDLMELPLPAMQLLLAANDLQVRWLARLGKQPDAVMLLVELYCRH